ncbi:MAG: helix-turn-helix domain-containing protein [Pseudomonadales bacterium]|nr:helix-turn-helix domain-containing protein [Pseudomonadales bacterium]
MKHVTIIAVPKALGSTVSIPLEMISAANDIARSRKQLERIVALEVVSAGDKNLSLAGGLSIKCDKQLDQVKSTDLVFIPGIWGSPRSSIRKFPELPDWLKDQHEQGALICGISTGTHFIAEAGLLDGKAATTHWRFFDQFQHYFPKVKLQRKRFITCADNIYCTGSVNAARDIMLHFIELLFGETIANEIARHFTHELKRSYETLLLNEDQQSTHHDEVIIKVQEWLQDNYQENIQIAEVAENFQMSVRSLNRRFKLAANTTPLQYLQELRIDQAKALLKQSNLVVSEVADKVGYQDASYFTGLFKKLNAVTPNEYRRLVRNKLFVAETSQQSIQ